MSKTFNWATFPIHLRNIIILGLFLCSSIVIIFAIYGGVRIYTTQEKLNTIKCQQIKIVELEEKICWLRQMNDLSIVLEQILTPLQVDELKMLKGCSD